MERIRTLDLATWTPELTAERSRELALAVESGTVLYLPKLPFELQAGERRFLDPQWSDGRAKNISFEHAGAPLKGALGGEADRAALGAMIDRYRRLAVGLVQRLLPGYAPHLRVARTSFRPVPVENRETSWRKDDSRLHVDAFPSRPNRGERILRVFANLNPDGKPRVWRVGESFEDVARRFLPSIPRPWPGSAWWLETLHITKSRRSEYDHFMLGLHDRMKADLAYQKDAPQEQVGFAPGSVWICFSDQTSHAAMAGQHMLEQTLHLPLSGLYDPARAPLRILERLAGRPLVAA